MLRLELEKTNGVLLSFKPDIDDAGPIGTIKITTVQEADALAFFEPTLKAFYFNKDGPRDIADGLPLRDPHAVYPHKRDETMGGCILKVGFGLGEMVFASAELDDFHLTPKAGGMVVIEFRAKIRYDEIKAGKLCMLLDKTFELSIEPVELKEMKNAA